MTDISHQTQQQSKAPNNSSNAASATSSADINARRDAASMMMSMSQLMDAAALHAQQQQHQQQQQQQQQQSVSPVSTAQSVVNGINNAVNPHLNHTSRGPHKKRTASNAALDESLKNGARSVAAHHTHHLVNGGGILRVPLTGTTPPMSSTAAVPSATAATNGAPQAMAGKAKASGNGNNNKSNSGNTSANGPLTEEEKKAERRAANRRSAFQSRQRRKILIEDLQRTVAALSKDNNDLRKSNDEIRSQLEAALLENRQLRQITNTLSAQAHAQQQVAAVAAQQQVQQPPATVSQQQVAQAQQQPNSAGSPNLSAQQAPPVPSIPQSAAAVSVAPAPPVVPPAPAFNPAALTSFLTNFSSQAAAATGPSPVDQQHIFNAKIALMAAQSRVSELEHHQAVSQAQAAASAAVAQQQLQAQAQAAASAALGFAHVAQQTSPPTAAGLSDSQHFARLQELLTRGIGGIATATSAPQPAPGAAAPSAPGNNAAGVDLTHLRSLLEVQQQQQQQQGITNQTPMPQAPESPTRCSVAMKPKPQDHGPKQTHESSLSSGAPPISADGLQSGPPPTTMTPTSPAGRANQVPTSGLAMGPGQDAPGIQLLIESLCAGQAGASAGGAAPPLDAAVRNYLQQQQAQMAQQQSNATATSIKAESN